MSEDKFEPKSFEEKWKNMWAEKKVYASREINPTEEKFYSLYSYPYPSGAGLHVGHVEGMVANDIVSRFQRMKGKNVMFPMGWDSFGLPAENYAIKTGVHPQETTDTAVITFKDQIDRTAISVDWETEVGAHWKSYYKWTQWIFLQMYKKGLAYKKNAPVNWCPTDQTVLANEQVLSDGTCERCGSLVIQKDLDQWFFKITDYADRLDADLEKVDWPESTKMQQRNWIGKSVGAEIIWSVENPESKEDFKIHTFTTRFDTIPGPTFVVIAPEYKDLDRVVIKENKEAISKYVEETKGKTDLERQVNKEKTGIFTGSYAINPYNGERVPVYVADYVLVNYGTGAVMGMPGHDQRDFEFAKKFNLPIKYTLKPKDKELVEGEAYEGEGYEINSGEFDGLWWTDARDKIIEKLEKEGRAIKKTNYRIRDWLLSRQRYWGCPIPIIYDPEGNAHPVPEEHLPVNLPTDVDFRPTGESPLVRSEEFHKSAEELYGKGWRREVDTMDTFVDSSWYFFRHIDSKNDKEIFSSEKANYWLPTDLYMIGSEHIVLHLLYARFFTKFLFDEGLIKFDEPFQKMRHMGLIHGPDGRKMSKRWGNVINPTDEVEKFGADTLRMYEMFMGPLEEAKDWNDRTENGVFRFLTRVWNLKDKVKSQNLEVKSEAQEREINKLIKKVAEDIENMSFNTAVAKMMEFVNFLYKQETVEKSVWERFIIVIAPFGPYIAEELWSQLGNEFSVHQQKWPSFDPSLIKDAVVNIAVQVNGKLRATIEVEADSEQEVVQKLAMAEEQVKKYVTAEPKKVIYVKNRILNIVV